MAKKHGLVIVDENDPKLRLEQLVGKKFEEISFNDLNPSKNSKNRLDRTIRKLIDENNSYLAVYLKAVEKNANIAVIKEKNGNSINANIYSVPEINSYCPTELFDGGFGIDHTSNKYCLTKSFGYSRSII